MRSLRKSFAHVAVLSATFALAGLWGCGGGGGGSSSARAVVVFSRYFGSGQPQLGIANPDATNVQTLAVFGYAFCPHPDGSKIVLGNNAGIATVNPDGSSLTQLTATNQDEDPIYSPDGTKILFGSTKDGNYELYVMDADGSNEVRLTNVGGVDYNAEWSPDGQFIVFSSSRDTGTHRIWRINADGSDPVQLTDSGAGDYEPAYSPDGTKIVFSKGDELWIMDADGSNPAELPNSSEAGFVEWGAMWSPDGSKIIYVRSGAGQDAIYTVNPDGTEEAMLIVPPDGATSDTMPRYGNLR